ncbi:hypothetical protein CKO25_09925 [Thiocapsa imhoffii]|uniref:Uncharacterized protein n=1 Tax=Thiocapsa imhoffii TaxID=382777 RepID=A0A9X0WI11_9GAMM|nr:hypothetical protein [Thiocapsa imhoffii]
MDQQTHHRGIWERGLEACRFGRHRARIRTSPLSPVWCEQGRLGLRRQPRRPAAPEPMTTRADEGFAVCGPDHDEKPAQAGCWVVVETGTT